MSIADKVKAMLGQHSDKTKSAVDETGDMTDQRTGRKYADKVDMMRDKAKDTIDRQDPPQS